MKGTSLRPGAPVVRCESLPQRWVAGHVLSGTERLLNRSRLLSPGCNVGEPSCFRGRVFVGLNFSLCLIHGAKWYMFVHKAPSASRGRSKYFVTNISSMFQKLFFFLCSLCCLSYSIYLVSDV